MSPVNSGRVLALPAAMLLVLAGCVAAPVAQLAAQAMSKSAAAPGVVDNQTVQAPDPGGMAQIAHGLDGMLQRVSGGPSTP